MDNIDQHLRAELLRSIVFVSAMIDRETFAELSGSERDLYHPRYLRLKAELAGVCRVLPRCRFLYLMGRSPDGAVFFFADSEPVGSGHESPAGQVYGEASEVIHRVFLTRHAETEGPTRDRWGTWVSALVPIYDAQSGGTLAVVGMDVDASDWRAIVVQKGIVPIIYAVMVIIVIVISALLLGWRNRLPEEHRNRWLSRYVETLVVFMVGCVLTFIIVHMVRNSEVRARHEAFLHAATTRARFIVDALRDIDSRLMGALVRFFDASVFVDRDEFALFSEHFLREGAVRSLRWIPIVPASELPKVEEKLRRIGFIPPVVWETDGRGMRARVSPRETYYPIVYAEPRVGNEREIGRDLGALPVHRNAIETAEQSGLASSTDPYTLSEDAGSYPAITVYRPVFDTSRHVKGFVSATVDLERVVSVGATEDFYGPSIGPSVVNLTISALLPDGQIAILLPRADQVVGDRIQSAGNRYAGQEERTVLPLVLHGRTYALSVHAGDALLRMHPSRGWWMIAVAGALVTASVSVLTGFLSNRRFLLERMVTERTAELSEREERFRRLFEESNVSMIIFDKDTGEVIDANRIAIESYGFMTLEDLKRQDFWMEPPYSFREALSWIRKAAEEGPQRFEWLNRKVSGELFWEDVRLSKIHIGGVERILATSVDITERKRAEERIEYLAYYDILTGLPNRNLFIDRLQQGISWAQRTARCIAVLVIDVDRFTMVNDTYGVEVGNKLLYEFGSRLVGTVRKADVVARIGNDEFGVALLDIDRAEDIVTVMEKIRSSVSRSFVEESELIAVTCTIGISVHPNDGKNAKELVKAATLALSIAKQGGRNTYQFYDETLNKQAARYFLLEKELRRALENEEFVLFYQPYWDIDTKKVVGMEALVRWRKPDGEVVLPGHFIPVLEESKLIVSVGEWILRTAVGQLQAWQQKGLPVVPVSVNLSPVQFVQRDLARLIEGILRELGVSPSLLVIEITEGTFAKDIEASQLILEQLKNIGVSIAIDDFGTGYSSFAHLKRFPIDRLKIDMSFIREIGRDLDTGSIVAAVIIMAHLLNMRTIAEGVETEEQWRILKLFRCDMGQGYYVSQPLPVEEMEQLLKGGTFEKPTAT